MYKIANSNSPSVNYLSNVLFVKGAGLYTLLLATLLVLSLWERHNMLLVSILFLIIIFQSSVALDKNMVRGRVMFMIIISLVFMLLSTETQYYKSPLSFGNKQILGLALWMVPYLYIILAAVDRIDSDNKNCSEKLY
jgi:hypothetical protein